MDDAPRGNLTRPPSGDRFRVFRATDGSWRFQRESADGLVVATSLDGFHGKEAAALAAIRMDPDLPIVLDEPPPD
jgi:uncharacterized protein YegP (UPF0339 family)